MQKIFSMLFLIFTFQGQHVEENLAKNSKKSRTPRGSWGLLFPTPGTLGTWWHQGAAKCQVEWWSGLSRESPVPRPCWTLLSSPKPPGAASPNPLWLHGSWSCIECWSVGRLQVTCDMCHVTCNRFVFFLFNFFRFYWYRCYYPHKSRD